MRKLLAAAALLFGLPACSAVGAWIYQDPSYALQGVSVRKAETHGGPADSVELVFIGCNLNDYDITETSILTSLKIGGENAGQGDHAETIFLGTRDSKKFTVTVPVQPELFPADRASRPFEVLAVSQVRTPIGDRSIDVRMAGRVERQGDQLNWRMKDQPCKPGTSTLPASFDTRPVAPERPRERPEPMRLPGATQGNPN